MHKFDNFQSQKEECETSVQFCLMFWKSPLCLEISKSGVANTISNGYCI